MSIARWVATGHLLVVLNEFFLYLYRLESAEIFHVADLQPRD
jgi:hypothetical protein